MEIFSDFHNSQFVLVPRDQYNEMETIMAQKEHLERWTLVEFQRNQPMEEKSRAHLMKIINNFQERLQGMEKEQAAYIQHMQKAKFAVKGQRLELVSYKLQLRGMEKVTARFQRFLKSHPDVNEQFKLFIQEDSMKEKENRRSSSEVNVSSMKLAFDKLKAESPCKTIEDDKVLEFEPMIQLGEVDSRSVCSEEEWVPFDIDEDHMPEFVKKIEVVADMHDSGDGDKIEAPKARSARRSLIPKLVPSPPGTAQSPTDISTAASAARRLARISGSKLPVFQGVKAVASGSLSPPPVPPSTPALSSFSPLSRFQTSLDLSKLSMSSTPIRPQWFEFAKKTPVASSKMSPSPSTPKKSVSFSDEDTIIESPSQQSELDEDTASQLDDEETSQPKEEENPCATSAPVKHRFKWLRFLLPCIVQ